jgi:hypothetical protein
MNRNQRFVALMGLIIFIGMGLIPPWIYEMPTLHGRVERPASYSSIFAPPNPLVEGYTVGGVRLDVQRLLIGWFVVSLSTGILVFCLRRPKLATSTDVAVKSRSFVWLRKKSEPVFGPLPAPMTPVDVEIVPSSPAPPAFVEEGLPTKWLWFWLYIRLPLGVLASLLYAARGDTITSTVNLLFALWLIGLFFGLRDRKLWAWKQNIWIVFAEPFTRALRQYQIGSTPEQIGNDIGVTIGVLLLIGVWSWPNYVYFKKRKHLFH